MTDVGIEGNRRASVNNCALEQTHLPLPPPRTAEASPCPPRPGPRPCCPRLCRPAPITVVPTGTPQHLRGRRARRPLSIYPSAGWWGRVAYFPFPSAVSSGESDRAFTKWFQRGETFLAGVAQVGNMEQAHHTPPEQARRKKSSFRVLSEPCCQGLKSPSPPNPRGFQAYQRIKGQSSHSVHLATGTSVAASW